MSGSCQGFTLEAGCSSARSSAARSAQTGGNTGGGTVSFKSRLRELQLDLSENLFCDVTGVPASLNPFVRLNLALELMRAKNLSAQMAKYTLVHACDVARQACNSVDAFARPGYGGLYSSGVGRPISNPAWSKPVPKLADLAASAESKGEMIQLMRAGVPGGAST